jgi:hypothetical protein
MLAPKARKALEPAMKPFIEETVERQAKLKRGGVEEEGQQRPSVRPTSS